MVAEELTKGNLIQLYRKPKDKEKTIHKIKSVYFDETLNCDAVELEDGFCVNIETGIEGVPLTEEILTKTIFEHIVGEEAIWEYKLSYYDEIWHCGNGYFLEFDGDNYILYQQTDEDTYNQLNNITYVHELQNLYYFLEKESIML